jgi:serine/threonine protein kinase
MCEVEVHESLANLPANEVKHCRSLFNHFLHEGAEGDGDHLCLALELQQATLEDVRRKHGFQPLPVPIIKRILRHTLRGIAALHKCGFAHTGVPALSCSVHGLMAHNLSRRRQIQQHHAHSNALLDFRTN